MSLSGVYPTTTYSDTYIMHRCKTKHNASLLSMMLYKKSGESQKGNSPQIAESILPRNVENTGYIISRFTLKGPEMTNEEIIFAIRAGEDVTENMEKLYKQNRGMIRKLTEKFKGIEDPEDLQQEAYFGLVRAVNLWDPEREAQFLTFAVVCIKTVLYRYITDCGALIRVPANQKTLIYKYDRIMGAYRKELGRDATPDELQVLLGINKNQFEQLKKDRLTTRPRSTSEPIGGDEEDITLEDTLRAEGNQYEDLLEKIQKEQLSRELWAQVDKLPEREADVVHAKYQRGETYIQCGERLGVSPERVRQLHERALRTLRKRQVTKHLIPYITDSAAYSFGTHSGLSTFRQDHTTAQERLIMKLEEYAGPIWANRQEDYI